MKVLALDTATSRGSVALLSGRELVTEFRLNSPQTHSARLLRSIRFLLDSAGWELQELELIAAGIGPGSFTGIRIGISTALGLAKTIRANYAGISGLDALANQVHGCSGRLGVVMDAQRNQVYFGLYVESHGQMKRVAPPILLHPLELRTRISAARISLVGDGAFRYKDVLRNAGRKYPQVIESDLFIAGAIGRLALDRKRSWRKGLRLKCDPLYIRPPDARKPASRKS